MVSSIKLLKNVEELYASHGDPPFSQILRDFQVGDDEEALAELIEADGRARIALGMYVELMRYLDAVPHLDELTTALDAAIDVTLRSLSESATPTAEAVETLVANYPRFAATIREAASLANAVGSTTRIRERLASPPRVLPSDFGPRLRGGETRYQLRHLLGKGSWGEVYLGLDRQLSDATHEALVAIKVLTGRNRGAWARQRLMDEAAKARRVSHPNVVRVLDRGVSADDEDFVVYEHVEGGDLGSWLDTHALTARQAAVLMSKIARGVQAAHAAGLVHCDLKPGNVLMTARGEPRVSDFGIAVRDGEGIETIRERDDGRPVGNIAFISPEQFRLEPGSLTVASDVYALGGILFFLVSGRLPNGASADEIARTHADQEGRARPPSLSGLAVGVDRDLDAICRTALSPVPEARYASAAALADDLERWVRREPVSSRKSRAARRVYLACRRRPLVALVSLVSAVAVLWAGLAAYRWSVIAQERSFLASSNKAKFDTMGSIIDLQLRMGPMWRQNGLDLDVTPMMVALDWTTDGQLLGDPLDPRGPWRQRIPIVKEMLERRRNGGQADSIETLLWRVNLGLWSLNAGKYSEAEPVLDDCLRRWDELLKPHDDPYLLMIRRLKAVAISHRLAGKAAGSKLTAGDVAELEQAMTLLEPLVQPWKRAEEVASVRQLAWGAVLAADAPSVLNRPDQSAKALALLRKWEHDWPSTNILSPTYRAMRMRCVQELEAWEKEHPAPPRPPPSPTAPPAASPRSGAPSQAPAQTEKP